MTQYAMKLNDRYFDAVANGTKTFEIRKDDRGFRVGDTLVLYRVNDAGKYIDPTYSTSAESHTSDTIGPWLKPIRVTVKYILTHDDFPDGIPEGYVVMSIEKVKE